MPLLHILEAVVQDLSGRRCGAKRWFTDPTRPVLSARNSGNHITLSAGNSACHQAPHRSRSHWSILILYKWCGIGGYEDKEPPKNHHWVLTFIRIKHMHTWAPLCLSAYSLWHFFSSLFLHQPPLLEKLLEHVDPSREYLYMCCRELNIAMQDLWTLYSVMLMTTRIRPMWWLMVHTRRHW